jgi:hypothetical protein
MSLLAGVLLAEVLPVEVLLVAELEMVFAVSGLLEKRGTILRGSVTLEEEEALLFSDASLVTWYSWDPFSLVGWTGGHRKLFWYFQSLPICQFADITMKVFISAKKTEY